MPHPDHALWKQSWRANQIDFHLPHVHPLLIQCWPALGLEPAARVFVPLCGKSLDLMWLHAQGHDIAGVELSPVAVHAFFQESGLQPRRIQQGGLTRWSLERLAIYCGDFFRLRAADLLGVRAVYDRASLTALPDSLRARYVAHLAAILPAGCEVLLLTVEDLEAGESQAEAGGVSGEIAALYRQRFDIALLHEVFLPAAADAAEGSVHKAYRLRLRAA